MVIADVFNAGRAVVNKIEQTQTETLTAAAELIARSFLDGKKFFVSGSGHSHTVAEEMYGRAGGLAFPIPILTPELTMTDHPTKSSYIERLPGYAAILVELYKVGAGDVVMIASNSGRNAYPVELALEAKARGAKVIAITSVAHSNSTTSRHASGKHLLDIADVVIDNCGVPGDSSITLKNVAVPVCPTSSIANAFICQALTAQTAENIAAAGVAPPIFLSLNSMPQENRNEEYYERYTRGY